MPLHSRNCDPPRIGRPDLSYYRKFRQIIQQGFAVGYIDFKIGLAFLNDVDGCDVRMVLGNHAGQLVENPRSRVRLYQDPNVFCHGLTLSPVSRGDPVRLR
jgi:hypothetical protein